MRRRTQKRHCCGDESFRKKEGLIFLYPTFIDQFTFISQHIFNIGKKMCLRSRNNMFLNNVNEYRRIKLAAAAAPTLLVDFFFTVSTRQFCLLPFHHHTLANKQRAHQCSLTLVRLHHFFSLMEHSEWNFSPSCRFGSVCTRGVRK